MLVNIYFKKIFTVQEVHEGMGDIWQQKMKCTP